MAAAGRRGSKEPNRTERSKRTQIGQYYRSALSCRKSRCRAVIRATLPMRGRLAVSVVDQPTGPRTRADPAALTCYGGAPPRWVVQVADRRQVREVVLR